MANEFSPRRHEPLNVQVVNLQIRFGLNYNLVRHGGDGLMVLREDWFDNALDSCGKSWVISTYDIALSGGEPYAVWS